MTLRSLQRLWAAAPRPTLLGRAVLLVLGCLLFNAACWIAAGICLSQANGLLGLALLAWTLGLRHGLDADHISAIDNATRQMVSLGRLPLTCGLFFSLGHSTIVIVVNIAIAVSVDVYDKLGTVGSVGGIVGASVSSSFLFLVACINTFFLIDALRDRREAKRREAAGLPPQEPRISGGGCLVRIIAPVLRAVDTPWKLYPVGILFGFGFDTASSIALLAISAIAARGPHGEEIAHGKIVILPFLFTAGMSFVDSLDSILMLYAYAQPELRTRGRWLLFSREKEEPLLHGDARAESDAEAADVEAAQVVVIEAGPSTPYEEGTNISKDITKDTVQDIEDNTGDFPPTDTKRDDRTQRMLAAKTATMSDLSISLTLLSILVALAISLIQIMGLIGENCARCAEAAESDPGLAGRWWRAWAKANDASGYVGAAIVGCFVAILLGYHLGRWMWRRQRARQAEGGAGPVHV